MKSYLFYAFVTLLSFGFVPSLSAQGVPESQVGIANYFDVEGTNLTGGDIIVLSAGVYKKSSEPYEFKMIGVVTDNPAVALDFSETEQSTAVASSGVQPVKVSGENGPIKEGDYITSSTQPGIGMRASEAGYVLGIAMDDFPAETSSSVAVIPVSLEVDYSFNPLYKGDSGEAASGNFWDVITLSSVAVYESPSVVFRYVVAAFIIVFSILLGFLTFSRVASNGILAIGRNPMAGKLINFSIIVNVILTIVIIGSGILVAYFVVTL